jgi:hypothetical protein
MSKRIKWNRSMGKMPENTVCVTRWSRFSNPYRVGKECETREEAAELFERDLLAGVLRTGLKRQFHITVEDVRRELAGKNLACACPIDGEQCHGDVLIRIANGGAE